MARVKRLRVTVCIATALVLAWAAARAADWSHISITDVGTAEVDIGASAAHELSGITFAGPVEGEKDTYRYLAVSDNSRTLHTLKVGINPETGSIASCAVVSGVELAAGGDLEGVAFDGSAGTVFVGESSSVAFGDYMTGANHVLPTAGAARCYSGLSTLDFVRWTTWQEVTPVAAAALSDDVARFADAEALPAHAAAARAWARADTDVAAEVER